MFLCIPHAFVIKLLTLYTKLDCIPGYEDESLYALSGFNIDPKGFPSMNLRLQTSCPGNVV